MNALLHFMHSLGCTSNLGDSRQAVCIQWHIFLYFYFFLSFLLELTEDFFQRNQFKWTLLPLNGKTE